MNDSDDESDDVSYAADELSNDEVQGGEMEEVEGTITRNEEQIGTVLSGFTQKSFQCGEECFDNPESEKWEDQLLLAVGKQWVTMDHTLEGTIPPFASILFSSLLVFSTLNNLL
ncbi:unnamed protein product [Cuscuta epithymum]|uniref:Uncharacterized protein n=1 Tax=Cuscuta epithymum TaxID=186058 RepID=A0AAV0E1E7_9ASTE|nr:unnamed protein product [Cuscuta epithymum]